MKSETEQARKALTDHLDRLYTTVKTNSKQRLVLLVDETQELLKENAFLFRCFRWWLHLKRHTIPVVAVFTGTAARLSNFYRKSVQQNFSRDGPWPYYESGSELYSPFFKLHTIGIFDGPVRDVTTQPSDYSRSIPYGRPLFALMQGKHDHG